MTRKKIDGGGPAFGGKVSKLLVPLGESPNPIHRVEMFVPGMTYRQWLVGMALSTSLTELRGLGPKIAADVAASCHKIADAIIAHQRREEEEEQQ